MPTSGKTFDTVRRRKERQSGKKTDYELLQRCWQAWNNLEAVRMVRDRAKRYCYGDQWGDTVRVYKNGYYYDMTEREYLKRKRLCAVVEQCDGVDIEHTCGNVRKAGNRASVLCKNTIVAKPVGYDVCHDAMQLAKHTDGDIVEACA